MDVYDILGRIWQKEGFRGNIFFCLAETFVARSRLSLLLRGFPECPKRKIAGKIALRLRSICRLESSKLDLILEGRLFKFFM